MYNVDYVDIWDTDCELLKVVRQTIKTYYYYMFLWAKQ